MCSGGNSLDNAPVENFFGLLKQEMYCGETIESIGELEVRIRSYIYWYNHECINTKLSGLSPIQYR
ncbi:transposase [Ruoffia tabacinasalis]|uniref:Transposase n=1 Tax=Ruoffia tabacinasalis TaxID=87458 RepID=A0A5R9DRF1_9LACT|nr:transposase [Ruoffia tabacinasalis]